MTLIDNLEKMLAAGKDDALLRFSLGGAYLNEKDWQSAAAHLAKAVEHDPDYSAAWKLYGKALTRAQRTEEAIEAYRRGIGAAEEKGDVQAAKEMRVFLRRLERSV